MSQCYGWDICICMLVISLGLVLLLILLFIVYFIYFCLQDLCQELIYIGQLIVDQLVLVVEYGVIVGNMFVLQKLLQVIFDILYVCFIEVCDCNDNILVYVEQLFGVLQNVVLIDIFYFIIQCQCIVLVSDLLLDGVSEGDGQFGEDYFGWVVVGMFNDVFSQW